MSTATIWRDGPVSVESEKPRIGEAQPIYWLVAPDLRRAYGPNKDKAINAAKRRAAQLKKENLR